MDDEAQLTGDSKVFEMVRRDGKPPTADFSLGHKRVTGFSHDTVEELKERNLISIEQREDGSSTCVVTEHGRNTGPEETETKSGPASTPRWLQNGYYLAGIAVAFIAAAGLLLTLSARARDLDQEVGGEQSETSAPTLDTDEPASFSIQQSTLIVSEDNLTEYSGPPKVTWLDSRRLQLCTPEQPDENGNHLTNVFLKGLPEPHSYAELVATVELVGQEPATLLVLSRSDDNATTYLNARLDISSGNSGEEQVADVDQDAGQVVLELSDGTTAKSRGRCVVLSDLRLIAG